MLNMKKPFLKAFSFTWLAGLAMSLCLPLTAYGYNYSLETTYPKPHAYADGSDYITIDVYAESARCREANTDGSHTLANNPANECPNNGAGGWDWQGRSGIQFSMTSSHNGVSFNQPLYTTDSTGHVYVYIRSTVSGDHVP